jgi:hypothetical protein
VGLLAWSNALQTVKPVQVQQHVLNATAGITFHQDYVKIVAQVAQLVHRLLVQFVRQDILLLMEYVLLIVHLTVILAAVQQPVLNVYMGFI